VLIELVCHAPIKTHNAVESYLLHRGSSWFVKLVFIKDQFVKLYFKLKEYILPHVET